MGRLHRGSCFCGAVEIKVAGEPIDMGYCHCSSCRSYSGAPLVAFTIWQADDVSVAGSFGSYNKVGTSDRRFCIRCGGHFSLEHPELGLAGIRAAILPTVHDSFRYPQSHHVRCHRAAYVVQAPRLEHVVTSGCEQPIEDGLRLGVAFYVGPAIAITNVVPESGCGSTDG